MVLPDASSLTSCTFQHGGGRVLIGDQLHGLQSKYALEQDPNKKRDILEQILALIPIGWEELFTALSDEENPHKVLLLIAELKRRFEEREEGCSRVKKAGAP